MRQWPTRVNGREWLGLLLLLYVSIEIANGLTYLLWNTEWIDGHRRCSCSIFAPRRISFLMDWCQLWLQMTESSDPREPICQLLQYCQWAEIKNPTAQAYPFAICLDCFPLAVCICPEVVYTPSPPPLCLRTHTHRHTHVHACPRKDQFNRYQQFDSHHLGTGRNIDLPHFWKSGMLPSPTPLMNL